MKNVERSTKRHRTKIRTELAPNKNVAFRFATSGTGIDLEVPLSVRSETEYTEKIQAGSLHVTVAKLKQQPLGIGPGEHKSVDLLRVLTHLPKCVQSGVCIRCHNLFCVSR